MKTILIVDDDPDFVEISRLILQDHGYTVITASDGDSAMETLSKQIPNLVLLDIMMSGILDGVAVAHHIAENAALQHIPVVMISSIADSPMAAMFPTDEYLPVNAWLSKPVPPDVLVAQVARIVGPDA